MTNDTKRALEAIKPIAEIFGIEVSADDKYMYCNGKAIGIACNSDYATCLEFVGYAFLKVYMKNRSFVSVPLKIRDLITRYWVSDALKKKMEGQE